MEGVLFDVEKNAFWPASWGERPPSRTAAVAVAKQKFADVPVLVPFFVHRFLPASPAASGSPVFSVYQTDVICYGNNLAEYCATEFLSEARRTIEETRLRVEFWSDLAEGGDFTVLW
ncbi:hypothetical protein ACSVHC_10960 [Arthrobacter sp. KNU-44]|uniref:hypothetical protein n=1 Tax=unclassified Arthrobacter TaxID=235627 RepID=UPI003F42C618